MSFVFQSDENMTIVPKRNKCLSRKARLKIRTLSQFGYFGGSSVRPQLLLTSAIRSFGSWTDNAGDLLRFPRLSCVTRFFNFFGLHGQIWDTGRSRAGSYDQPAFCHWWGASEARKDGPNNTITNAEQARTGTDTPTSGSQNNGRTTCGLRGLVKGGHAYELCSHFWLLLLVPSLLLESMATFKPTFVLA